VNEERFKVTPELAGARVDKAVLQLVPGLSRARVKKAIEARAVRVNGRVLAKGALVAAGDEITISPEHALPASAPATPTPNAPLVVRFESATVLVVDKPPGMPTAPLRGDEVGTLANALVGHYPELKGIGHTPREPGLIHRLDTETSGLLVVARTAAAFEVLSEALKEHRIEKRYLLVCAEDGLADDGSIEFPITNHPKDKRRVYACIHPRDVMRYEPRPASTKFSVVRRVGPWALVEVTIARALRHQIRVHFAAIEHPLAGDTLYGGAEVEGLGRHALHASSVSSAGGDGVDAFEATSELPSDMAALVPG
jgi:23S rRNA pseudouridine1911/1915/1917 synthase